jgi:hypothetical protein
LHIFSDEPSGYVLLLDLWLGKIGGLFGAISSGENIASGSWDSSRKAGQNGGQNEV